MNLKDNEQNNNNEWPKFLTGVSVAAVAAAVKYRVIHKSLRDFRTPLRNNQDRHGRKEHINRHRISPSFFVLGALAYFQVPPLGVVVKKNGVHSE